MAVLLLSIGIFGLLHGREATVVPCKDSKPLLRELYYQTSDIEAHPILTNLSTDPFDVGGLTMQGNLTLTAVRPDVGALAQALNISYAIDLNNVPFLIRNFFDVDDVPQGSAGPLGISYYYTTFLGSYSLHELIARQSPAPLLFLYVDSSSQQAMQLTFQQTVGTDASGNFFTNVTLLGAVYTPTNITETYTACNQSILHNTNGVVLPSNVYTAALYSRAPSSVEEADADLAAWTPAAFQRTFVQPTQPNRALMDQLLLDSRFSKCGAIIFQYLPSLYSLLYNISAAITLLLPIDGTQLPIGENFTAFQNEVQSFGVEGAIATWPRFPVGITPNQVLATIMSLTVVGAYSQSSLVALASRNAGCLPTLLSQANVTGFNGSGLCLANISSVGEVTAARSVSTSTASPSEIPFSAQTGYVPLPSRLVSSIYANNGALHVLSGAISIPAGVENITPAQADALSDYVNGLPWPNAAVPNASMLRTKSAPGPAPALAPLQPAPSSSSVSAVAIAVPVAVGVVLLALLGAALFVWLTRRKNRQTDAQAVAEDKDIGPASVNGKVNGAPLHPSWSPSEGPVALPAWSDPVGQNGSDVLSGTLGSHTGEGSDDMSWLLHSKDVVLMKDSDGKLITLGCGGFGQVYRGTLYGTTPVAVKSVLHTGHLEHTRKQLEKEVNLLKQCRHQNLVQFYGAYTDGEHLMLVLELMPKGNLFKALHASSQGSELLWRNRGKFVMLDIARGLSYLHSRKQPIIHCDIKSPNILLDGKGVAKIADLGMSRVMLADYVTKSWSETGTWHWAAPELVYAHHITEKVDIFSLGMCLYEVVTGEVPHRGRLRDFRVPDECTQSIAELFEACTAQQPEKRPSAQQVYAALLQAAREATQQGSDKSISSELAAVTQPNGVKLAKKGSAVGRIAQRISSRQVLRAAKATDSAAEQPSAFEGAPVPHFAAPNSDASPFECSDITPAQDRAVTDKAPAGQVTLQSTSSSSVLLSVVLPALGLEIPPVVEGESEQGATVLISDESLITGVSADAVDGDGVAARTSSLPVSSSGSATRLPSRKAVGGRSTSLGLLSAKASIQEPDWVKLDRGLQTP